MPDMEEQIRYFLLELTEEELNNSVFLANINFITAPMEDILDTIIRLTKDVARLYDDLYGEEKKFGDETSEIRELVKWDYLRKYHVLRRLLRNCYLSEAIDQRLLEKEEEVPYLAKMYV